MLRANVLDAPYLSSLIILKAADAAANQQNAPCYNSFSSGRGLLLASLRLFSIAS